ncbi:MAG TPA: hypothetical protein DD490_11075 [Acidobacteria bacterium]|nr:hypothetical protein [Acidobacteriota bacterium]
MKRRALFLLVALAVPTEVLAGGAWVPPPGKGDVQLGVSRKTASTSWNREGETFRNRNSAGQISYHDFRYAYLSGEVGLLPRLSTRFLVTYLDGFEGPHSDLEQNTGLSDAWVGFKLALAEGDWPMAVGATMRTPTFYDLPGAYSRYLFDAQGQRRGVSPEWRGLLKHDYSLTWLLSHSYRDGRGWINLETGYTWREGAPADQVPLTAEVGYPLPFWKSSVKGSLVYVQSVGNDSPRQPDDRFGRGVTTNFNDASMARLGVALLTPLGRKGTTTLEVGYNQWVWGVSARRYREPYLSIGRSF